MLIAWSSSLTQSSVLPGVVGLSREKRRQGVWWRVFNDRAAALEAVGLSEQDVS
jgi:hypothetical protein